MPMADFGYYTDTYLGTAIPEKAFPGMAKRAEEALQRLQRIYRVNVPGEDSRKLAVCAMAVGWMQRSALSNLRCLTRCQLIVR